MSGAGLIVDLSGRESALAALAGIAGRLDHARPMFDDIGASLVTSTQRRFEEGRAPDGSPWPPSLRAKLTGGKTLIETARLMNSQTHIASDAGVEVGTNVIYAAVHQLGHTFERAARQQTIYRKYDAREDELSPRFVKKSKANYAEDVAVKAHAVTLPKRPFLGLDDHDEAEILTIAEGYVGGQDVIQDGASR
jgi:phage virion morphogenesis protein